MTGMMQLLFHLSGDYLTQGDWMAANKTKHTRMGYLACFLHCVLYTTPFAFHCHSWKAVAAIFISHFMIDKYRLAIMWVRMINWNWRGGNYGFMESKPVWLSTWLLIIIDNTLHIFCNYYAILYL